MDGEHRFDSHPWQWRLNTRDGSVVERQLDDAFVEFPRVSDTYICSGARYSYMAAIDTNCRTLQCNGLLKYDLQSGLVERLRLPTGYITSEQSFAPRIGGRAEDDGFLVGFVTDTSSLRSEFWITPAQDLAAGPVARIALPQRVPPRFHGRWLPADILR